MISQNFPNNLPSDKNAEICNFSTLTRKSEIKSRKFNRNFKNCKFREAIHCSVLEHFKFKFPKCFNLEHFPESILLARSRPKNASYFFLEKCKLFFPRKCKLFFSGKMQVIFCLEMQTIFISGAVTKNANGFLFPKMQTIFCFGNQKKKSH